MSVMQHFVYVSTTLFFLFVSTIQLSFDPMFSAICLFHMHFERADEKIERKDKWWLHHTASNWQQFCFPVGLLSGTYLGAFHSNIDVEFIEISFTYTFSYLSIFHTLSNIEEWNCMKANGPNKMIWFQKQ